MSYPAVHSDLARLPFPVYPYRFSSIVSGTIGRFVFSLSFLSHESVDSGDEPLVPVDLVADGGHVLMGGAEFRVGQSCDLVDIMVDVPALVADATQFSTMGESCSSCSRDYCPSA